MIGVLEEREILSLYIWGSFIEGYDFFCMWGYREISVFVRVYFSWEIGIR